MTCIIGYVQKETVYIGGDSAGVAGLDITLRKDPKVFKNRGFVMGFTTSFRMGQLLMSSKFKPKKQKKTQSDYDYMITEFIDTVMKLFKDSGYLRINDENQEYGGNFLVGYKGVLYSIDSDFQVGISILNYDAVGCGESYAKGAMEVLTNLPQVGLKPEDIITQALEVVAKHSGGVSAPFIIESMSK